MIEVVRERLLAMRDEEFARMLRHHPSPALAVITELLAALDELRNDAQPATRAVVATSDEKIRLTLYGQDGAVASAALDPIRAVALAGELIQAALPKLA
jgi:hypothetical protein